MILLVPVLGLLAVAVGIVFGWKFVLAPLLGFAIWRWSTGMLRSMAGDARAGGPDEVVAVREDSSERTLYWCEECGTEVLLLIRGSGSPPRHCGMKMHERAEILS